MKRILVNAGNLTGSGAQAIGLSLFPRLVECLPECQFTFLLPETSAFCSLEIGSRADVRFTPIRYGLANNLTRQLELVWNVPRMARQVGAQVCLTLGDLTPVGLPCPSVLFLQQSLLVYSDDELCGLGGWSGLKRYYLSRYFGFTVKQNARVVVQTPVMAERLARRYQVEHAKIEMILQPVPQHVLSTMHVTQPFMPIERSTKQVRLLFLSAYYPHKNFAILPKLVRTLRHSGLAEKVHIFLTIDEARIQSPELLAALRQDTDVITNLGELDRSNVASALRTSTALFLPTLVESYGLIYLEAMACGTPILTSDRDFARWMCGELAVFFDPLDPNSIVDSIAGLLARPQSADSYDRAVQDRMAEFPKNWTEVARQFAHTIDKVCL